jgi:hypothetical protein
MHSGYQKCTKLFEGSKLCSLVLLTVALTWKGVRSIGGMMQNYLRRNVSQCHFVHHKSHWPENKLGSPRRKASYKPCQSWHGLKARNASELYAGSPLPTSQWPLTVSVLKANQLIPQTTPFITRSIKKHINTQFGRNQMRFFFHVQESGKYSYHWALNRWRTDISGVLTAWKCRLGSSG